MPRDIWPASSIFALNAKSSVKRETCSTSIRTFPTTGTPGTWISFTGSEARPSRVWKNSNSLSQALCAPRGARVRTFGKSRIEQEIVLSAGSPRIDFPTEVDWNESQKTSEGRLPRRCLCAKGDIRDSIWTSRTRPTHANTSWDMGKFEVCAQKWADLSETGYGVALLNDCKYGHDIQGNILRLSLLRAPISPDPLGGSRSARVHLLAAPSPGRLAPGDRPGPQSERSAPCP